MKKKIDDRDLETYCIKRTKLLNISILDLHKTADKSSTIMILVHKTLKTEILKYQIAE